MTENDSPEIFIVRQQERGPDGKFYFHANRDYSMFLSMSTTASTRIGVLPAGKKFRVKTVVFGNYGADSCKVNITEGSGLTFTKLSLISPTMGTVSVNTAGLVLEDDPYVVVNNYTMGQAISLFGELDPDEDGA